MRCLNRNKVTFYYATYVSAAEIDDEYGNATGTYTITYSNPILMKANISAARGNAEQELFGISLTYDKTIITDNMSCPISETSILWIDTLPIIAGNGTTTTKHDYIVKGVAKSLNNITYAIARVNAS